MKTSLRLLFTTGLLAAATALGSHASAQTYQVTINTAALIGHDNAPFYLDLQMNYGGNSGIGNTATVTNFNFDGGAAQSTPNSSGLVTGNLGSTVTMTGNNTSQFNLFQQQFNPGDTLTFDVSLTKNATGLTPDGFIVSLDDNSTFQIPTTSPDGTDLAEFDIRTTGVNTSITTQTWAGANDPTLGDYSGITISVAATPEPSAWMLALGAAGAFAFLRRRLATK